MPLDEGFVSRARRTLVETAILGELRQGGNFTLPELAARLSEVIELGAPLGEVEVAAAAGRLVDEGLVRAHDGRHALTHDGLVEVERVEHAISRVASAEIEDVTVPDERTFSSVGGSLGP